MKRIFPISAIFTLLMLSGCDYNRNKPGNTYFPDMEESQAYETYSANPNTANGATNQLPVKGTVPREMVPFDFVKTEADKHQAGIDYINPIKPTMESKAEGKRLYNVYCVSCHGDQGDGKGFLYTSGKYPFPPASLRTPRVQEVPDGEIFHVISVGFGVMGPHAGQIAPEDRWRIVAYLKGM